MLNAISTAIPIGPGRASTETSQTRPTSRSFTARHSFYRQSSRVRSRSRTAAAAKRDSIISNIALKRTSTAKSQVDLTFSADAGDAQREKVFRWDGVLGARAEWDSIRRDHELWTPEGDAMIHFYAHGQSRRGPSIRLVFSDIVQCNCDPLLEESLLRGNGNWELYLPAPASLDRAASFQYHLTTRNLFAWMFDRPVVGAQLGPALVALHERLDTARPDPQQNAVDMQSYIDSQGYSEFRDNPDHAVAVLVYAEHFKLDELWMDAFVHSAGMYDRLAETLDWESVSLTSKALLSRASCEMSVRLERASQEVTSFMEDATARMNLPEEAVRHLDRFRSFLHSYYMQKLGYWPPTCSDGTLPKSTFRSMYSDFRSLFELLADTHSTEPNWKNSITGSTSSSSTATSKIDISATINSFDRRYRFTSLPYTLPLLPENLTGEAENRFAFLTNFGKDKRARMDRRAAALAALQGATNSPTNAAAASSALVRAYREYERTSTLHGDERIAPATARAARWLLVYAALQTLADVTRAVPEVRDSDGVAYPLCCLTAGTPPWNSEATVVPTSKDATAELDSVDSELLTPTVEQPSTPKVAAVTNADAAPPSPVPSAVVAPLDLERVAIRRRSTIHDNNSSAPSTPPPPPQLTLHAPKPRRPAPPVLATYNRSEDDAEVADEHDVPDLSPTSDRRSHHSRNSSDGSSSQGEARTPTGAGPPGVTSYFDHCDDHRDTTASPSIYEEAPEDERHAADLGLDLPASAPAETKGADELAARWRGEIGVEDATS